MTKTLATLDVETTRIKQGEIPRTLFWGFYDGATYRRFENTSALLKFLRQSQTLYTLLHHTNFDAIQLLVDGAPLQIIKSHNNRLILCGLYDHNLLNSYSVFPLSLGSIFGAFGYEKTPLSDISKRNYEDCVYGLECLLKLDSAFLAVCGVSPLNRHTIASAAFYAAEKAAGKMPKNLDHENAYRGGRVEVFDTRKMNAACYDINSSYPFAVCDCPEKLVLLHCRVTTKDYYAPFFDAEDFDSLAFPNGTFKTWIFQDVLDRYVSPSTEKTRIKILSRARIDSAWLGRAQSLIRSVFALKQKHAANKDAVYVACKLFLNSMYGRIGLRGFRERCEFRSTMPRKSDCTAYRIGKRFLCFWEEYQEPRSNFPLAAYITDNARGRLYHAVARNAAVYCDTDSIFTAKQSLNGQRIGTELGEWKREGRGTFQASNVKDYTFDGKETRKGGSGFMCWTLKQFASGKSARLVARERITPLQKRKLLPSGATVPHIISR